MMPGEPVSATAWIYAKRALASAKLESRREEESDISRSPPDEPRARGHSVLLRHPERHKVGEPSVA
jgi:hypothetical protein